MGGSSGADSPPAEKAIPSVNSMQYASTRATRYSSDSEGPGHAQGQRLVDAAIGIGKIDVEVVDRRAEGHRRSERELPQVMIGVPVAPDHPFVARHRTE